MKELKKSFTLLEMLFMVFIFLFIVVLIVNLINTALEKKHSYGVGLKKISVHNLLNSQYSKLVCYYNKRDFKGITIVGGVNKPEEDELYIKNSTNTDEENALCDELKSKFLTYTNTNGDKILQFLVLKNSLRDINNIRIVFVFDKQIKSDGKPRQNVLRIFPYDYKGFLTETFKNDILDKIDQNINNGIIYKYDGNTITNKLYGYYFDNLQFNFVDDHYVNDENIFYFNFYLIKTYLRDGGVSYSDYLLYKQ